MSFYDDDDDYYDGNMRYTTQRKVKKIANDPTKHYPNKDEAKLLRKIMSETGMTEEQIRADKTYRIQLSKAQKAGQKAKRTDSERWCHSIIRSACKETKLAKEHPKTIEVIEKILAERKLSGSGWGFRRAFLYSNPPESAKILLRNYGSTYKK